MTQASIVLAAGTCRHVQLPIQYQRKNENIPVGVVAKQLRAQLGAPCWRATSEKLLTAENNKAKTEKKMNCMVKSRQWATLENERRVEGYMKIRRLEGVWRGTGTRNNQQLYISVRGFNIASKFVPERTANWSSLAFNSPRNSHKRQKESIVPEVVIIPWLSSSAYALKENKRMLPSFVACVDLSYKR